MQGKSRAAYMRDYRRRKKAEKLEANVLNSDGDQTPKLEVGDALREWCELNLVVPFGHADEGKPLILPDFAVDFLNDTFVRSAREAGLFVARKNAKSAIIAAYLIARLIGSIRVKGYRAGVCSVSREKASELYQQCVDLCGSAEIDSIEFRVSPFKMIAPAGTVDFLSADRSAGHAAGCDDAIMDELGLLPERRRDLVNGLRSSVSARNGRFIAISILGDSPFTKEMIERKDLPTTCVHLYAAPADCAIDDMDAWHAANPALGTVKSIDYMRDEAARCAYSPADENSFRAFDLNQPYAPERVMICDITNYKRNCTDEPMPRGDRCVIGVDLGGSNSMSAAVIGFPDTGRVETYAAFGGTPNLAQRGQADGVGGLYELMEQRGELTVYAGYRVTPVDAFLNDVFDDLGSIEIMGLGCDRYRKSELLDALDEIGRRPQIIWRGTGAGAIADGSYDVRAFQRCILQHRFSMHESLAWVSAISESSIRYEQGNPALDKRSHNSRIDILQAAVIMAGLLERATATERELEFELVG
ncbi:MAG: terminase large subunit [Gammaproteobacteria bacterium]|nr:terminase large subunit [Gammaproteobacteria bacterium]